LDGERQLSTSQPIGGSGDGGCAGPTTDAASYRVLAFEDSYDIKTMLTDAKVSFTLYPKP